MVDEHDRAMVHEVLRLVWGRQLSADEGLEELDAGGLFADPTPEELAAPELLESLSMALESLEAVWEQEGFYTCDKDLQRMRSAIAKAKGES